MAKKSKQKNKSIDQSQEDRNNQTSKFMKKKLGKSAIKPDEKEGKEEKQDPEKLEHDLSNRELAIQKKESDLSIQKNECDKKEEELKKRESELVEQSKDQQAKQKELDVRLAEAEAGFEKERKEAIKIKENDLSSLEKEHSERLKKDFLEIKQKERELLNIECSLDKREASAKAGFVDQEKEAKKLIAAEVESEETQLTILKNQIADEQSKHSDWLASRQKEFDDSFAQEQLRLATAQAELQKSRSQIDRDQQHLKIRKDSQEQWEAEIRAAIEREHQGRINDLKGQLEQERIGRQSDQGKLAEQNKELIKFRDFQRAMGDADPQAVQDELNQRKEKIKELEAKIKVTGSEDLSEKCADLEVMIADQQDKIQQLMRDLEQANAEVYRVRLSVAAKHNLEKEKKVLELHNKSLDTAITQLRVQLDELIEKQQGSKVFPALSALDQKHRQNAANLRPVPDLKEFCTQVHLGLACVNEDAPLFYRAEDIRLFLAGLAMSNLHILQGMSGTGKTSLAIAFSKVVGGHCTNIAVQAGWRDKDDLLGHYNAFEKKFYEREALQALYRAQLPEYEDRLNIILLDEMNLSRPEQYFAELLSALELRVSERSIILVEEEQLNAPNELIQGRKIRVPDNVWFIGTANHDETTNEFADKTYDRSHVMELMRNEGQFEADDYENGNTYSYESLRNAFEKASSIHENEVIELLKMLNESYLALVLKENFSVSWGNRLERHAKRFIPVVIEAGGSIEEALDHLLATKVFRRGKVTGRFDISPRDIDAISDALTDIWKELNLKDKAEKCLTLLDKDRKRLRHSK